MTNNERQALLKLVHKLRGIAWGNAGYAKQSGSKPHKEKALKYAAAADYLKYLCSKY